MSDQTPPSTTATWFIALPIPAGRWFFALPPPHEKTTIFHPDDLHLTIAFLGRVGEERALAGWAAFRWPLPPLMVTLGPLAPMGNPRRPSALAALLDRERERVEEAMGASRGAAIEAAGAELDARSPKAHVTLARPSRSAGAHDRALAIAWATAIDLGGPEVLLDRVALYASATGPGGRRYRKEREVKLEPAS